MTLGQRVEQRRKERRMNQDDLAERARISQGLLSRIETGQTKSPGADVLKGLARALGCSIDWLVGLYDNDHDETSSCVAVAP
jgi:transcriptional regulator with XRE-family HTH domain